MADASAESIQQKIQIARRDAEALKDRIKRKKDELADTTCESNACLHRRNATATGADIVSMRDTNEC